MSRKLFQNWLKKGLPGHIYLGQVLEDEVVQYDSFQLDDQLELSYHNKIESFLHQLELKEQFQIPVDYVFYIVIRSTVVYNNPIDPTVS